MSQHLVKPNIIGAIRPMQSLDKLIRLGPKRTSAKREGMCLQIDNRGLIFTSYGDELVIASDITEKSIWGDTQN